MAEKLTIIGGGLAGYEAAQQDAYAAQLASDVMTLEEAEECANRVLENKETS